MNRVGRGAAANATVRRLFALASYVVVLVGILAGCSSQADLGGLSQPVGGQLRGLTPGETVTLQDNLGDNLTLSSNGGFTFPTGFNSVALAANFGPTFRVASEGVVPEPSSLVLAITAALSGLGFSWYRHRRSAP